MDRLNEEALKTTDDKPAGGNAAGEDDEQDEEEAQGEDRGVDYRLLASLSNSKRGPASIPRRGEKDFEPLQLGVNVQERALNESRNAMFSALQGERTGAAKTISHALFPYPDSSEDGQTLPYVILNHGNHFTTMGTSVRSLPTSKPTDLQAKKDIVPQASDTRTVLLPEEALYLTERGSMMIWRGEISSDAVEKAKAIDVARAKSTELVEACFSEKAVVMTVQEAWSHWGPDVDHGRYAVYAHLKRLGYTVLRAPVHLPPSLPCPQQPPLSSSSPRHVPRRSVFSAVGLGVAAAGSLWSRLLSALLRPFAWLSRSFISSSRQPSSSEWTPLIGQRPSPTSSSAIYSNLRIISSPRDKTRTDQKDVARNAYEPYYHVWKPTSAFKKREPGEPDFKIAIVDARQHDIPSQADLAHVFPQLDETDPPKPRFPPREPRPQPPASPPSLPLRALRAVGLGWLVDERPVDPPKGSVGNPFPALKHGDRDFLLAVVEGSTVSWLRLGRGVFGEMPIQ